VAPEACSPTYQTTWHHIPEDLNHKPLTAKPCHRTPNLKCQGFLKVNAFAQKNPQHYLKLTSNYSKYRTCVKTYSFFQALVVKLNAVYWLKCMAH
jgi:hypothetical protein